jgi:hypothetical protein
MSALFGLIPLACRLEVNDVKAGARSVNLSQFQGAVARFECYRAAPGSVEVVQSSAYSIVPI